MSAIRDQSTFPLVTFWTGYKIVPHERSVTGKGLGSFTTVLGSCPGVTPDIGGESERYSLRIAEYKLPVVFVVCPENRFFKLNDRPLSLVAATRFFSLFFNRRAIETLYSSPQGWSLRKDNPAGPQNLRFVLSLNRYKHARNAARLRSSILLEIYSCSACSRDRRTLSRFCNSSKSRIP